MKTKFLFTATLFLISLHSFAQGGWSICNFPSTLNYRTDDIFMLDTQTGYAVDGGHILKTTDGGNNWFTLVQNDSVWCRSVEFINSQKGFVGAFMWGSSTNNVLRSTNNGGASWIDITPLIDSRARKGICGLAIPDSNTIYGCGNYYQDSAYIVKSVDGGNTWSFIDMHTYAAHLIDMYFINKDTGFATGSGVPPAREAVILYTIDGGLTWTFKFQDTINSSYCWKIQHLTDQTYFASLQNGAPQRILKSTDGGMNWNIRSIPFPSSSNGIAGIGFIDSLKGWTGGGWTYSYESNDGGLTWDTIPVCPGMNRLFKVNDTLLFAGGISGIWKYSSSSTSIAHPVFKAFPFASINCYPNPASKSLSIDLTLFHSTHALIVFLDEKGSRIKLVDNTDKAKGVYHYQLNTDKLSAGVYYIVLKTHADDQAVKVVVSH